MTVTIQEIVARWSDPEARPLFKGMLIDADGCCCAQGDVLRACGWSDSRLRSAAQYDVDKAVATELGISLAHACLLRIINDRPDGCPQDVLARPEKVLGKYAGQVLTFWRRLDSMDAEAWDAASDADSDAAGAVPSDAAGAVVLHASWHAAWHAAWALARGATRHVAGDLASWASNEIQGQDSIIQFVFLPVFGINHPSELAETRPAEGV